MNKKPLAIITIIVGAFLLMIGEYFLINKYACKDTTAEEAAVPQAMMLLIEFQNTDALANMVNDMKERNIKGLLMVNEDFIEKHYEVLKEILKTGVVELAPSYDYEPFWGMSYDKQYEAISNMIKNAQTYLGVTPRVISSRYMASDENTVKVAQELGIEYITARGTTELATTIYKPEEYDVKIISVSNIDIPEFKYGSFCDYSFYERNGSPEDMEEQYKRAIQNKKFIAVSHTYIGGYKKRWNDMWHRFWDNYNVNWVDLDTLGTVDKTMPMWQIPVNKNAPYTPEKIRPAIPYEKEENVINPCKVEDLNEGESGIIESNDKSVVIFHNNAGAMCLELLDFLKENNIEYEEHLTTDTDFGTQLNAYKGRIAVSKGVSDNYGYYPIIFVNGTAFSGFNKEIGEEILKLLE
ncbi:MAG TPA: polysaccharide deacetylase family protein [Candidatus Dojkabacteria bacterium]|jgi:vacuolar-type H+-ATPase subunit F/Vma7|nr:polysaccharide deacetylase family protein [Candidatus Dojkabacteria bacterium]